MRRTLRVFLVLTSVMSGAPVWAQDSALPESRQSAPGGQTGVKPEETSPTAGLWDRSNLFGDAGGLRSALNARGITIGLQETSEVLGNLSGGVRRTVVYEGLTQATLGVDLGKAIGLRGGTFNVSALQIHGRGLSLNALDNNLNTVSSIEALRGTLLFELWYEQALFDNKVAIRVGQMAADQEFIISKYAAL
ncbi:MAG TPA: carbohydrate porin, partial [Acetobacteraceae bacterium]|nr:carbohydrate porin [Acetobacteraceae bacterium]